MSMQIKTDYSSKPFLLFGFMIGDEAGVIAQDAGRSTVIAPGTVMGKIAATGKYVPLTTLAAVDGSGIPAAIYVGEEIPAADIVAGDISNAPMTIGGSGILDKTQLVFENSLTLATVIQATAAADNRFVMTIEDYFRQLGISFQGTLNVTNAQ